MQTDIILNRYDFPIFRAEPSGFEHIEVDIKTPDQQVHIKATITIEAARLFADRLVRLADKLARA